MTNGRTDPLNELLSAQTSLMQALGINPSSGTLTHRGGVSKTERGAISGIVIESVEILQLVEKADRKWKPNMDDDTLLAEIKEEMIDVVFFVLELCVLLKLTGEDVVDLYRAKLKKNVRRLYKAVIDGNAEMTMALQELLVFHFSEDEMKEMAEEFGLESREAK